MVVRETHALPKHPGDHRPAPTLLLGDDLENFVSQFGIASNPLGLVVIGRLSQPQDPARLACAELELVSDYFESVALGLRAYHFPRMISWEA